MSHTLQNINKMPQYKTTRSQNDREIAKALQLLPFKSFVLDVGCGSGVYASLAMAMGAKVHAFDISPRLLQMATETLSFSKVQGEMEYLKKESIRRPEEIYNPKIWKGDASDAINYISGPYKLVLCLGGTLNMLKMPERSIELMIESLDRGGRLFIEIENKKQPKYLKELFKDLLSGKLGWLQFKRILSGFRDDTSLVIERELVSAAGKKAKLSFKILSLEGLKKIVTRCNAEVVEVRGSDWLNQLLPFEFVGKSKIQSALSNIWPFARFASIYFVEVRPLSGKITFD